MCLWGQNFGHFRLTKSNKLFKQKQQEDQHLLEYKIQNEKSN